MSSSEKNLIIVTGASSGIGEAISRMLLENEYRVLGLARDFTRCSIAHKNLQSIETDLSDIDNLEAKLKPVLATVQDSLRGVVLNAGMGRMGYLEQLSVADIQQTMDTNFVSPAILSKLVLPLLKRGDAVSDLVFIGSESALRGERQGSIYCASKFALRGFAQALREECGKSAVRVGIINPGAVRTPFFDKLHFEPGSGPDNAIAPEDVAQAVLAMLNARVGTVIDEINLSPMNKVWQKRGA